MELKKTISSLRQENAALSDAFVCLCSGGSDWHTVLEGLPAHVSQRLPPSPPPLLTPPRTASPLATLTHMPHPAPLLTPPRTASPLVTLTHLPPVPSAGRQGGSLMHRPDADPDAAADAATVVGDPVDSTAAPAHGVSGAAPRVMATSESPQGGDAARALHRRLCGALAALGVSGAAASGGGMADVLARGGGHRGGVSATGTSTRRFSVRPRW